MTPGSHLSTASWWFLDENLLGSWGNWNVLDLAYSTKNLQTLEALLRLKLRDELCFWISGLHAVQLGSCENLALLLTGRASSLMNSAWGSTTAWAVFWSRPMGFHAQDWKLTVLSSSFPHIGTAKIGATLILSAIHHELFSFSSWASYCLTLAKRQQVGYGRFGLTQRDLAADLPGAQGH